MCEYLILIIAIFCEFKLEINLTVKLTAPISNKTYHDALKLNVFLKLTEN